MFGLRKIVWFKYVAMNLYLRSLSIQLHNVLYVCGLPCKTSVLLMCLFLWQVSFIWKFFFTSISYFIFLITSIILYLFIILTLLPSCIDTQNLRFVSRKLTDLVHCWISCTWNGVGQIVDAQWLFVNRRMNTFKYEIDLSEIASCYPMDLRNWFR